MTRAILLKGGSVGTMSDDVTAMKEHVLSGYNTITVDSDDEIISGTMVDNTGWTHANLTAGTSILVPQGYHDGTKSVIAASLASQTGVDSGKTSVGAGQMLSGYQGWVNGAKVTGTITSLSGGTYYPSSAKQTISCAGKYMTSNIVIDTTSIQSILSFSFASRNYSTANFKWQNPSKGPFYGVVVRGKQGSYPTSATDGNAIYTGYGTNQTASGTSYSGFQSVGTGTWYFTAYSYYILNGSNVYDSGTQTSATFNCYECNYCGDCQNCSTQCRPQTMVCSNCHDYSYGGCGDSGCPEQWDCGECNDRWCSPECICDTNCGDYCYDRNYPSACNANT